MKKYRTIETYLLRLGDLLSPCSHDTISEQEFDDVKNVMNN